MNQKTHAADRAVVIGASICGLLAARVLCDHFAEVVLLERDELPEVAAPRKGTPHAVHPHGLLARGREVLDELFPGIGDALVAQGGLPGDIGSELAVDAGGQRFARMPLGIRGIAVSRLTIEAELRRRVRAIGGVRILCGTNAIEPLHEGGRVCGVRYRERDDDAAVQTMSAALVVDCSGRASRSPQWLKSWGYEPAGEERVVIDLAYTSAYFGRDAAQKPALAGVIGTATERVPRPSILLAQEPDAGGQARWVAGLGGYAGDHVAATREAMAERARAIGNTEIAALAAEGELIGPVMRYVFAHSQRRRYERLHRFPARYLVMGDAIASFNPVYGQGMTCAVLEAAELRRRLGTGEELDVPAFYQWVAGLLKVPWRFAAGADFRWPQTRGERPKGGSLLNGYTARLQRSTARDPHVRRIFTSVQHMLMPPSALFAPAVVWRVLRSGGRRR